MKREIANMQTKEVCIKKPWKGASKKYSQRNIEELSSINNKRKFLILQTLTKRPRPRENRKKEIANLQSHNSMKTTEKNS